MILIDRAHTTQQVTKAQARHLPGRSFIGHGRKSVKRTVTSHHRVRAQQLFSRSSTMKARSLVLISILSALSPATAASITKQLAPGVQYTQDIDPSGPLVVNVVRADLTAPGVRVETGMAQDRIGGTDATYGRENVSRYARRHRALVAVNADFFPFTGDPLGIGIHGGEFFSEPWTGNDRGGPRTAFGISADGKQARIDRLGFLGDLQCADGARGRIAGMNRAVGKNETVIFTPAFAGAKVNKAGGACVLVTGVNLPVKSNKLMTGVVQSVNAASDGTDAIPSDGVVLSGGPGTGAAFLTSHLHPGDHLAFVLGVGAMASPADGIKVALLPPGDDGQPSRAGIDRTAVAWSRIVEAVGGGPRLLSQGRVDVDASTEGFDDSFSNTTHPRTAVGIAEDGHTIIIVTVDGRQAISKGMSLTDLAGLMKRYGAYDAMNLDGGGSTVMAVAGVPVDSPGSSGEERPVADMLAVYADKPTIAIPAWDNHGDLPVSGVAAPTVPDVESPQAGDGERGLGTQTAAQQMPGGLRLAPDATTVTVGATTGIALFDGPSKVPSSSPQIIWQGTSGNGVGFVNQSGTFVALKPGNATINALYHGQRVSATLTVVGAAPVLGTAIVRAALSADPSGAPNRQLLSVHVVDSAGHTFTGTLLKINITRGTLDSLSVKTDEDGNASVGITWDGPNGGTVSVAAASSQPVTFTQGK